MHLVNQTNYADSISYNNNSGDVDLTRISSELSILLDDLPEKDPVKIENSASYSVKKNKQPNQRKNNNKRTKTLNKLEKKAAKLVCKSCLKEYKSQVWFTKHKCDPNKMKLLVNALADQSAANKVTAELFVELPLCENEHDNQNQQANINKPNEFKSYLDQMRELKTKEFAVLHLNINAVFNKINELNLILETKLYDIVTINESKLDEQVPVSFFTNPNYSCLRRDRKGKGGGGLLVFIMKKYNIIKSSDSYKGEVISFQLKINNKNYNFISCYKSPKSNDDEFIDELGNILFEFDPAEPMFIIGDLNMDQACNKGDVLKSFLDSFNFKNFVFEFTRVCKKFYKKKNKAKSSKTIIDVVFHNSNLVSSTKTIDCPFSDHRFVSIKIKLKTPKDKKLEFIGRSLPESKLDAIKEKLSELSLEINFNQNVNENLNDLQNDIRLVMDDISPLKPTKIKKRDYCPWADKEWAEAKNQKEYFFWLKNNSDNDIDLQKYKWARTYFQSLNRNKMIEYFKTKEIRNFKSSKLFWKFYSASIRVRSDKTSNGNPIVINDCNNNPITDSLTIGNNFNIHFTTLNSNSLASKDESSEFIKETFTKLKRENKINPDRFKFVPVTQKVVDKLLSQLDSTTGPGVSGIPVKVLKHSHTEIAPAITNLFNQCIATQTIPDEWKLAVVTPLFKSKGAATDMNNYRGISVLPPLGKLFEKILALQIIIYFNMKNLFYDGQYGFRNDHSCETALHDLISKLNKIRNDKLVAILLFIDFRKAFDLADPNLLILKLFHYGFDNNSINLIRNYFKNRSQRVKVDGCLSELRSILLGFPQGSLLGPLFFIIFINDLPFLMEKLYSMLYADDTTLLMQENDLDTLIDQFKKQLKPFTKWCSFNRLDVNWDKTFIMFVTTKRIKAPAAIEIDGKQIQVVDQFKLLGITIDNKLNFLKTV